MPRFSSVERGLLRAEELWVRQGGRVVLQGVDLEVGPGDQVAVVGPNGSGKTTLLLSLKGVLAPESGRVSLGSRPVDRMDGRVGIVFANPEDQGVAPAVEDDVAFGLETLGLPAAEIRGRVEESLRAVGLWERRSALVQTLSGGLAQSLSLAGVLALGAQFLLLDEATSMLSPWDRDSLMATVVGLRREGLGVVQVTHQAEELLWASRVVALEDGRVVFGGTPEEYFGWEGRRLPVPAYEEVRRAIVSAGRTAPEFSLLAAWLAR